MFSKHNNFTIFWLSPGFRELKVYYATIGFYESSDMPTFVAEEVHVMEDDEI